MRKLLGVAGITGLALALVLATGPAAAQSVDCDDPAQAPFGSVQDALFSGLTFVEFTGTCVEDLFIPQDGTSIEGFDPGATIVGGVFTRGVTGLQFQNLTIDASGKGIFFTSGTYVELDNVHVTQSAFGVELLRHTGALIRNSHIGPSTSEDLRESCSALCLIDNSEVRLIGTTVEDNGNEPLLGGAIILVRNSSASLRGGNVISNTGTAAAIDVSHNSSLRQDAANNPDTDVVTGDVRAFGKAYLDIYQATVNGNIAVDLDSTARLGARTAGGDPARLVVNGGITLDRDSALAVENPEVTINGDVRCLDSASWTAGRFTGTGLVNGCRRIR